MSDYDDLKANAVKLKDLAISKTGELYLKAAGGEGAGTGYALVIEQAEKDFADVDKIFDDWLDLPDPGGFSGSTGNLDAAKSFLSTEGSIDDKIPGAVSTSNPAITGIGPTGAFMQGWTGGTATSYALFAGNFAPVTSNQWICCEVLKRAIEAEAAIWKNARESVGSLGKKAVDAMEVVADCSPEEYTATLTVLAAISGIVAVPFTAGGSLVAAYSFAAIGAATGVGGLFAPKGNEIDARIDGGSPSSIIQSAYDYLADLNTHISECETDVATALNTTATELNSSMADAADNKSAFVSPRPSVADNPTLGDHADAEG